MLEVTDLVVSYRRSGAASVRALDGVSIDLRAGETLGVIGESGSGKTTLGRAIIGLQPADAGSIKFEGQELANLGEGAYRAVRKRMSMIFQDPTGSLSPRKTVRALLEEPARIHDVRGLLEEGRVEGLLRSVGLDPGVADAYPHQLSGGQARRVGIARAIALDPRLVIADEPTAGLDMSVQGEVVNLMLELQARNGMAYLFITHNLALARLVCDRIAIVYRGVLVETGKATAVFSRPSHPYTSLLADRLGAIRTAEARTVPASAAAPPRAGCIFVARCPRMQPACAESRPSSRATPDGGSVRCHFPIGSEGGR